MSSPLAGLNAGLRAVRSKRPLILNITNLVAMDLTANVLLAVGASPLMATSRRELQELVGLASAVVVNMGTLDDAWLSVALEAVDRAHEARIPVVLDPAGSGASGFRTDTARLLMTKSAVRVVRGNASEIISLFRSGLPSKGVDSASDTNLVSSVIDQDSTLVRDRVLVASGPVDVVTAWKRKALVSHGDALMSHVTGMGCSASALVGALLAVESDAFLASLFAMIIMGVTGESARVRCRGPGSFRVEFIDALFALHELDTSELKVSLS